MLPLHIGQCAFAATIFFLLYFLPADPFDNLLAPGDAILFYVPAYLSGSSIWSSALLSGFPVHADIQAQVFYPLARLLPDYNLLVIAAYPIAAVGMYGFVATLTQSRFAGVVSGLIVSAAAFMIAHAGHLTIIHAAAWIPWLLWALQRWHCRAHRADGLVPAAVAVALAAVAGHPQVFAYGVLLAAAWGAWLCAASVDARPTRRFAALATLAFGFLLGLALAAVALLPFLELAGEGLRAKWSLAEFGAASLPTEMLVLFIFPNLYGAADYSPWMHYFGPPNFWELSCYVGLLPLALAALGVVARRDRIVAFWCAAAVIGCVLMLGPATPFGRAMHEVPLLGAFRAQARFGIIVVFAVATLAGIGVAAARDGRITPRSTWCVSFGLVALVAIATASVVVRYDALVVLAHSAGVALPPPMRNPAMVVPWLLAVASWAVLPLVGRRTWGAAACVLVVLVVDLGSFGWFHDSLYTRTPRTTLAPLEPWASLVERMRDSGARIAAIDGYTMAPAPVTPNLSAAFGLASVTAYGPVVPRRHAEVAGTDASGSFPMPALNAPILDILAIGWLAKGGRSPVQIELGAECGGAARNMTPVAARLPQAVDVAQLVVEADLACSVGVPDGTPVGEITLDGDRAIPVLAGRHVSEWAHGRADVTPVVGHARAPVAESYPAGSFAGHWYRGTFTVGAPVHSLALSPVASGVRWRIRRVELVGRDGAITPVPLAGFVEQERNGWRIANPPPGTSSLLTRAPPPIAWVVGDWQRAGDAEITRAAVTGSLAGGARFDPYRLALLDATDPAPEAAPAPADGAADSTRTRVRAAGRFEFDVESRRGGLLVVSESFHEGWRATVNGAPAAVHRVDGLVIGVPVPRGTSRVTLKYAPRLLFVSACITLLAALACVALAWPARRRTVFGFDRPATE